MAATPLTIAVVSGSRADWGLLLPVLRAIRAHPGLKLALWVTGTHLEPRFGKTLDAIDGDGFEVDAEVPLHLQTATPLHTSQALARALEGFAGVIAANRPDLVLLLGDRYEIFGAAQACALAGVPLAHIAGGDVSEGAYDDGMRHAISKLAQLHFPSNEEARQRLLRMGEQPDRVTLSGSPGIDNILATPRIPRGQLQHALVYTFQQRNLVVSFHPATLDRLGAEDQVQVLLAGLESIDPGIGLMISGSNADTGGDAVNNALQGFASRRPNSVFFHSLGAARYYSIVAEADLLVGNSSSGLYEAPTLGTPTLDIGIRQQGRLRGPSVSHCGNEAQAIASAIAQCLDKPCTDFNNPYGDGHAAQRIVETIAAIEDPRHLLEKRFYQVPLK